MLTISNDSTDNRSESVVVDACILANEINEQQEKYNALYKIFKEVKDKGIKFDYCPDAEQRYDESSLLFQTTINKMKENLNGLEYLIHHIAEETTKNTLEEMEKRQLQSYLQDVQTHNTQLDEMRETLRNLSYIKDSYDLQESVPDFKKDISMDFQVKLSNSNFKNDYEKLGKKVERVKKQKIREDIHDFIENTIHNKLEINAQSIIKRETAALTLANKQKIPKVASTDKKTKAILKREPMDKNSIKNKIQKISQEMDHFVQPSTFTLDTERISNSLGQISSVLKNHEQVINFIYDPFEEKKKDNISRMDPIIVLQSIDTVKRTPCLTEALAAAVVKMSENRFSDYNRRLETLNREIDGLDTI